MWRGELEWLFGEIIWRAHLESSFGELIWRAHLRSSFGKLILRHHLGGKYLVFGSSRSVKMREADQKRLERSL